MNEASTRLRVDIVIPIYNEEGCLHELAKRLKSVMDATSEYDWNVILVENGSVDSSGTIVRAIADKDSRFTSLSLVRNFGTEGGILAGLSISTGDAVITMQADLEDPPEIIPRLLEEWRGGSKYVFGRVSSRRHLPKWRTFLTKHYYRLANWASDGAVTPNASDFRLLDSSLRSVLLSINEQNLFLRGLVNWAGFPHSSVDFERAERFAGETKFDVKKVVGFAFRGILSQSSKPLRVLTALGAVTSFFSFIGLVVLAYRALFLSVPFAGFGTIVGLQVLFFGLTTLFLGLLAEYVALIYTEVRPRPHFVISETYRKIE